MKVVQIIDSLNIGGAERMAVNLANELSRSPGFKSYLCATRVGGELLETLDDEVDYIELGKKNSFDWKAFIRLRQWIKHNEITIIHAHGSSYFWATLLAISCTDIHLVWHDHYGRRINNNPIRFLPLIICSLRFNAALFVNEALLNWSKKYLFCSYLAYFKNFVSLPRLEGSGLSDVASDWNLVCVANFRSPKDHFTLVRAFARLKASDPSVSLHLIGDPDADPSYSDELMRLISDLEVEDVVVHGKQLIGHKDLELFQMGVLISHSEGMPMTILEYGLVGLPVIATEVGGIPDLLNGVGYLVGVGDSEELYSILKEVSKDKDRALRLGLEFKKRVISNYSFNSVRDKLNEIYST